MNVTGFQILEELPAEQIWEYRNRVQMRGLKDSQGVDYLGFYVSQSHQIISVDRCWIARKEINQALQEIKKEGSAFKRPYKVEIEVLPSGEIKKFWNAKHAAGGFRQVHDEQNIKLQNWVQQALTPGRILYDLYGGAGNLSRGLQDRMKEIHCVDVGSPESSENPALPLGQKNLDQKNYFFHKKPVLDWIQERVQLEKKPEPKTVILDPPREGLGENWLPIVESLKKLNVSEIVAVGCDVDNWARDLARLTRHGWSLKRVAALDLFPQTPHVESLAFLERDT